MSDTTNPKREILISKALSKLLRHRATSENLDIDANGFVDVAELLNHRFLKSNHASLHDIQKVVDTNDKKRFKLETIDGKLKICALQGHSIKDVKATPGMKPLGPGDWPQYILHGTFRNKLPLIKESGGLSKMQRNHIHFSYTVPPNFRKLLEEKNEYNSPVDDVPATSGVRKNCQVLIFFDVEKLKNSGLQFYKSENDVILSSGDENGLIGVDFISKILDVNNGEIRLA